MFPMNPLPKCALSKTSFGQPRPTGRIHEGIDLMASLGQEIYAVDNGVLTKQTVRRCSQRDAVGQRLVPDDARQDVLLLRPPLEVR